MTAPLAIAIAGMLNADPSLAATIVVVTGLLAANFGRAVVATQRPSTHSHPLAPSLSPSLTLSHPLSHPLSPSLTLSHPVSPSLTLSHPLIPK